MTGVLTEKWVFYTSVSTVDLIFVRSFCHLHDVFSVLQSD